MIRATSYIHDDLPEIPVSELRMGNVVYRRVGGEKDDKMAFNYVPIRLSEQYFLIHKRFHYGIPLSSQVLENADFINLNGGRIWQHLRISWFTIEEGYTSLYSIRLESQITSLKYLHELQNIFMELTEEELIINL